MSKGKTCSDCGGRGTVAFADYVVKCDACNGTGTISSGSGASTGGSDGDKK